MIREVSCACIVALCVMAGPLSAAGQTRPSRDTPAQPEASKPAAGRITGRVLDAANGRPMQRARVMLNAPDLGGRGALTDTAGQFDFTGLPGGRYTLTASKTGFISLSYGQRRPLQPGTPLQLADGQQLNGIEFRLPRGSVITGTVFDESGEPMPGTQVRVWRYRYADGARQLVPAGGGQTDDRGQYRIWGLNPGNYYVSAVSRNFNFAGRGQIAASGRGGRGAAAIPPGRAATPSDDDPEEGYAPTYYPGVSAAHEAQPIQVGLGAEVQDISFRLLLVPTARVSGRVTNADGSPARNSNVMLTPEEVPGRSGAGANFGGRTQADGAFSIANVPPGRYMLVARGENRQAPQYAAEPLTVSGNAVAGIAIALAPGATISGVVSLETARSAVLPDLNQFRVTAPATDLAAFGPNSNARADAEGRFLLEGVAAGSHWIRAQAPRGWMLKSVLIDGRETIDTPIEVRSGQKMAGLTLVFSDNLSEINGTITDGQGTPMTDYTVLAFPDDSALWRPQARHIMTARPDQNGRFQLRGLPPGEYFLATIDPEQPGEWFEPAFLDRHRSGAARVTLGDGDIRTQNFKISTR